MDLGLQGRTALITGGSRGIGAACARVLAAEGVHLVLVARDRETLAETAQSITHDHAVQVHTHACDLADPAQVDALAAAFPVVDILVNNAGEMPSGDILALSAQQWCEGFNGKVFAYVAMCRAYYPLMRNRGGGVIVNLSGIGATLRRWDYVCSGMGNLAVEFLTQTLGGKSPEDNIRVVCVSPGPVATQRQEKVMQNWFGSDHQPEWPFGRRATPEEIGQAVTFLASDRSAYTSGSVHVVDAGVSISRLV
jgi:NAD(P)-dependent dehydrogenase (short-subunit alcohol dehydrogenase family)